MRPRQCSPAVTGTLLLVDDILVDDIVFRHQDSGGKSQRRNYTGDGSFSPLDRLMGKADAERVGLVWYIIP